MMNNSIVGNANKFCQNYFSLLFFEKIEWKFRLESAREKNSHRNQIIFSLDMFASNEFKRSKRQSQRYNGFLLNKINPAD